MDAPTHPWRRIADSHLPQQFPRIEVKRDVVFRTNQNNPWLQSKEVAEVNFVLNSSIEALTKNKYFDKLIVSCDLFYAPNQN